MTLATSTSILRQKLFTFHSATFIRLISAGVRRHQHPGNVLRYQGQHQENFTKTRENFKRRSLSSLAPLLSSDDKPSLSENQAVGTVVASQANFRRVVVSSADSRVELLCVVRGLLKKTGMRVLVGDKVLVASVDWADRRGMIKDVFERMSKVSDPPVANVDHFLVLFSLEQPKIEPYSLTRFLVEAEVTGIPFTLALNKAELVDASVKRYWKTRLRGRGYEPLLCSVAANQGLDALGLVLRGQTSVIAGPSGSGKSTLINALRGSNAKDDKMFEHIPGSTWFGEQRVGEVSARIGRGKHTTCSVSLCSVSLLPLSGGGYLADTPGFNLPSLSEVTSQSLARHFPEIRKMLEENEPNECEFSRCLHSGEPGCLIKAGWERHSYYLRLLREAQIREKLRPAAGTKRECNFRGQSRKAVKQSMFAGLD